MKIKLISLFSACCILLGCFSPVFADVTSETVSGGVIDVCDAVALYDKNGAEKEIDGNAAYVELSELEKIEFDVSGFESGTYSVKIKYASPTGINNQVYLDTMIGGKVTNRKKLPVTTNATTFAETDLYKVYLPARTQTITFRNSSTTINTDLVPTAFIENVTFVYVGEENTSDKEIVSNAIQNVLNTTNGDGYNGTATINDVQASITGIPRAHFRSPGRWFKYDISDFKPGIYDLSISATAWAASTSYPPSINVYVDETKTGNYIPTITSSALTYQTELINSLGQIIITDTSETLKLECGGHYVYASDFTCTYVGPLPKTIIANNVVEEDGFYDNTPDSTATEPEEGTQAGSIILKDKEWLKYDVSDLDAGTYTVRIKYAAATGINNQVYLDAIIGEKVTNRKMLPVTTNATTFAEADLYRVYLPAETQTITFRNSSTMIDDSSVPTADIESFTFIYAGVEDTSDKEIISNTIQNVLNTTNGDGYNGTAAIKDVQASINGTPRTHFRAIGRWFKYDISDFKPGVYKMSISAAAQAASTSYPPSLNLYIDGTKIDNFVPTIEGEDGSQNCLTLNYEKTNSMGYITITDVSETLKLECGGHYIYASDFKLVRVEDICADMFFTDSQGRKISAIEELTSVKATCSIANPTMEDFGMVFIIASYKGNELLNTDIEYIDVVNSSKTYTFSALPISEADSVKIFAWKAENEIEITMIPITASKTLPKTV